VKAIDEELSPAGVYAFGSLIYREGAQFGDKSDIDLIVVMPEMPDALDRAQWLQQLLRRKVELEDALGKLLKRPKRDEVICSVVAVTPLEVAANIHKDGARDFFSANLFLDLKSGELLKALPDAGSVAIKERLVGECLRFAQKTRNSYLKVNALGIESLKSFNDEQDAAPKPTMRHAAMVHNLEDKGDADPGAEYDLDLGADRLTVMLHERRKSVQDLVRRYGARRGGRSKPEPLSSEDQLLLAELVLDAAVQAEARAAALETQPKNPSTNGAHSTLLFADRFASAFPGVRGIQWFDDPAVIKQRLSKLLRKPLVYEEGTPIWWSRGNANLQITSFADAGDRLIINSDEMNVRRIAAINLGTHKDNFVYVEVAPLPPTGLYKATGERIAEVERGEGPFSYYWEEFGIVDGNHLVTRSMYDDGAALIDEELQDIHGRSELRSRYVTPYNFVIAAGGSPILDMAYDQRLEDYLDAMLKGADHLSDIAADARKLPAGRY
jgi:predicted nucleotidyltransferase